MFEKPFSNIPETGQDPVSDILRTEAFVRQQDTSKFEERPGPFVQHTDAKRGPTKESRETGSPPAEGGQKSEIILPSVPGYLKKDEVPGKEALRTALELTAEKGKKSPPDQVIRERFERAAKYFEQALGATEQVDLKQVRSEIQELKSKIDSGRSFHTERENAKRLAVLLETVETVTNVRIEYAKALNKMSVASYDKSYDKRAVSVLEALQKKDSQYEYDPYVVGSIKILSHEKVKPLTPGEAFAVGEKEIDNKYLQDFLKTLAGLGIIGVGGVGVYSIYRFLTDIPDIEFEEIKPKVIARLTPQDSPSKSAEQKPEEVRNVEREGRPKVSDEVTVERKVYRFVADKGGESILYDATAETVVAADSISAAELREKYVAHDFIIDGKHKVRYLMKGASEKGFFQVESIAEQRFIAPDPSLVVVPGDKVSVPTGSAASQGARLSQSESTTTSQPPQERTAPSREAESAPVPDRVTRTEVALSADSTIRRDWRTIGDGLSLEKLASQKEVSAEQIEAMDRLSRELKESGSSEKVEKGKSLEQLVKALKGDLGAEVKSTVHQGVLSEWKQQLELKPRSIARGAGAVVGAGLLISAALSWYLSRESSSAPALERARVSENR